MSTVASGIHVREMQPDDRSVLLGLLAETLHWQRNDLFGRLFAWKHVDSPFGRSSAWVAVDGDRIVGFRAFMQWEFEHPDGRVRRAARAVDTATHPEYQGRGVFRRLTLHALEQLRVDGVDFVFNTPNASSRPGYIKMGWSEVGRLPIAVRPAGAAGLVRMVRSKVPAERWPLPATAGAPAGEILAGDGVVHLVDTLSPPNGLRTRRSAAYLRWRYGFPPLGYRAIAAGNDPRNGVAVFRMRRRGSATEAALCDVLAPRGEAAIGRALARRVARASGGDYTIQVGGPILDAGGYVRLPGRGPMLTWRGIANDADLPALRDWQLALGDIETL